MIAAAEEFLHIDQRPAAAMVFFEPLPVYSAQTAFGGDDRKASALVQSHEIAPSYSACLISLCVRL